MADYFTAIRSTTEEISAQKYPLPGFFQSLTQILEKGHFYWWVVKDYSFFKKAQNVPVQNGNPVVTGTALFALTDLSPSINAAVSLLIVAKCAEDILHQHCNLYRSYLALKDAINPRYPHYYKCKWKENAAENRAITPSLHLYFYLEGVKLLVQIRKIIYCTGIVLKELFTLAMIFRDTQLLAEGNSMAKLRACKEIVVWQDYKAKLNQDHEFLVKELDKRKDVIDRVLVKMGLHHNSMVYIEWASQFISTGVNYASQVASVGKEIVNPILSSGKIVPLQLSPKENEQPLVARFPSWGGEAVSLKKKALSSFITE